MGHLHIIKRDLHPIRSRFFFSNSREIIIRCNFPPEMIFFFCQIRKINSMTVSYMYDLIVDLNCCLQHDGTWNATQRSFQGLSHWVDESKTSSEKN